MSRGCPNYIIGFKKIKKTGRLNIPLTFPRSTLVTVFSARPRLSGSMPLSVPPTAFPM